VIHIYLTKLLSSLNIHQITMPQKLKKSDMPATLKASVENLSVYSMDDVKVYYNPDMPAQLQVNAYSKGTKTHQAEGQEKHLPHEARHVVRQKQGDLKPAFQVDGKLINDDVSLKNEAGETEIKLF
jgi:hypothetical protein